MSRLLWSALAVCAFANPAFAQQFEAGKPPAGEAGSQAYLPRDTIDYRLLLGPPPIAGSPADGQDAAAVDRLQSADPSRWDEAMADAQYVYPRFDTSFGLPVTRATSSALIALLNRAMRDAANAFAPAKSHFSRPRPYQRRQLRRVCGADAAPAPDPVPKGGSSYPSGHSVYGWVTAMILARVAPDRASALLGRAGDYSMSRQVCGVHFPSDTEAGHVLAVAVMDALDRNPAFNADLARASAEVAGKRE